MRPPSLIALGAALAAAPLAAQDPFQLSLLNPAQLVPEGERISGVRLNILYTRNANVEFVDLGFGFNHTTGNGSGLQWALISMTGDGLQIGIVNVIKQGGVAPVLPIINFTF